FSFLALPADDPFWTDREEPLPVEKSDFTTRFAGPRMLLVGAKQSGQVRWLLANNSPRRDTYRDKYIKFAYSSHYSFNTFVAKDQCPVDQALVFRHPETGKTFSRHRVLDGRLTKDGLTTTWEMLIDQSRIQITTVIRLDGEFELRQ